MPKTTSAELRDAFADSAGFLLGRSSMMMRQRVEKALAAMRLTIFEYVCLKLIGIQTGASQGSLGEFYNIDQPTMVAIVDSLEKKQLVVRERNPSDRRSYILRLTPTGNKVLARAKRIVSNQQRIFLSPLSAEEWETVKKCLNKLVWAEEECEKAS